MNTTVSRPGISVQSPGIRRSPNSFDQIPAWLQERDDVCGNAKRLYGMLRSVQRLNWTPSYAQLATWLHAGVRSIVRWMAQLVKAGLIMLCRRGQGLTNVATVIGLAPRSATEARLRTPVRPDTYPGQATQKREWVKKDRNTPFRVPSSYGQGRQGTVPAR